MSENTVSFRAFALQNDRQGVYCNNYPGCYELLAQGVAGIAAYRAGETDPYGSVGLRVPSCPNCQTKQLVPLVFKTQETAVQHANMMNAVGVGKARIVPFRFGAPLIGVALAQGVK